MERFRADTYGESFAEVYDEWYQGVSDAEAVAAFEAEGVEAVAVALFFGLAYLTVWAFDGLRPADDTGRK